MRAKVSEDCDEPEPLLYLRETIIWSSLRKLEKFLGYVSSASGLHYSSCRERDSVRSRTVELWRKSESMIASISGVRAVRDDEIA